MSWHWQIGSFGGANSGVPLSETVLTSESFLQLVEIRSDHGFQLVTFSFLLGAFSPLLVWSNANEVDLVCGVRGPSCLVLSWLNGFWSFHEEKKKDFLRHVNFINHVQSYLARLWAWAMVRVCLMVRVHCLRFLSELFIFFLSISCRNLVCIRIQCQAIWHLPYAMPYAACALASPYICMPQIFPSDFFFSIKCSVWLSLFFFPWAIRMTV